MAGLRFVALGAVVTAGAYVVFHAGLGASALLLLAAPAMITVGLAMVLAPLAPDGMATDLGEWLESLPRGRRLALYAVGAIGLGRGALLVLHLGGWSVEGVIDIVF